MTEWWVREWGWPGACVALRCVWRVVVKGMVDGGAAQAFRRAMGEPDPPPARGKAKGSSAPGRGKSKSGSGGVQHGATSARARAHQARARAADPLGIKAVAAGAGRLYDAGMRALRERTGLSDAQLGALIASASLLRSLRAFWHRWTRVKRVRTGRDWGREMHRAERAGKPVLILFDLAPGATPFQVPDPGAASGAQGGPAEPEPEPEPPIFTKAETGTAILPQVEDGHIGDDSSGDEEGEGGVTAPPAAGEGPGPVLEEVGEAAAEAPRGGIQDASAAPRRRGDFGAGVGSLDEEEEEEEVEEIDRSSPGGGHAAAAAVRDPLPHMGYGGGHALGGGGWEGAEEAAAPPPKPQVQLRPAEAVELRRAFGRMGRRDMSLLFCVMDVADLTGAVLAKACGVEKFPQVACVESADVKAIHGGRTTKSLERFAREMGGGGKKVAKKKNPMSGGLGGFKESSNAPAAFRSG